MGGRLKRKGVIKAGHQCKHTALLLLTYVATTFNKNASTPLDCEATATLRASSETTAGTMTPATRGTRQGHGRRDRAVVEEVPVARQLEAGCASSCRNHRLKTRRKDTHTDCNCAVTAVFFNARSSVPQSLRRLAARGSRGKARESLQFVPRAATPNKNNVKGKDLRTYK